MRIPKRLKSIIPVAVTAALLLLTFIGKAIRSLPTLILIVLTAYLFLSAFTERTFAWMARIDQGIASHSPETILAAAGLFVAFLGVTVWRKQKAFEIRTQTAWLVSDFYTAAADELLRLDLYAGRVQELYGKQLASPEAEQELLDSAEWLRVQAHQIAETRGSLSRRSSEAHVIRGRHEAVIANSFFQDKLLRFAESSLENLIELMWFEFPVRSDDAAHFLRVLAISDPLSRKKFLDAVNRERKNLVIAANALVTFAQGGMFPPTVWSVFRNYRRMREIANR
jgi:hypothetical protein